jgi:hypothetical protein
MKRIFRHINSALFAVVACVQFCSGAGPACAGTADVLPIKVGVCAETTITVLTDYFGKKILKQKDKNDVDQGVAITFGNKGEQYSHDTPPAVRPSKVGDKVTMCLISIPTGCPAGDNRGRVYRVTNLRTKGAWSLPDDIHRCGGA